MVDEGPYLPLLELAILLAKMVIVPLDASDPRLHFLLEDAEPAIIITKDESAVEKTTECVQHMKSSDNENTRHWERPVVIKADELLKQKNKRDNNDDADGIPEIGSLSQPGDVSHIVFTSGSTGRPKGCVVTHEALASYCLAKNDAHRVDRQSICFVASPHTFDPSLGDFFATWCAGAAIALAPRAAIFASLGASLLGTGATHLLTTPSLFQTLGDDFLPGQLPSLAVVALGGEPMARQTVEKWAPHVTLINTYGVTECCVYQAYGVIAAAAGRKLNPKLIERPLKGNTIHLMTEDKNNPRIVPDFSGEQGEIWIGGSQIGVGYLKRQELTAERFVEHPELGRCFRTGDIAVALSSGGWQILGRRDFQVKIRGQRVELGEIEEVLLTTTTPFLIRTAAVVLNNGQLVAWCVPAEHEEYIHKREKRQLLSELLRCLCEDLLPRHMVPSRFVMVEELPTTGTGKVARGALSKRTLPALDSTEETGGKHKAIKIMIM